MTSFAYMHCVCTVVGLGGINHYYILTITISYPQVGIPVIGLPKLAADIAKFYSINVNLITGILL